MSFTIFKNQIATRNLTFSDRYFVGNYRKIWLRKIFNELVVGKPEVGKKRRFRQVSDDYVYP